MKFKGGIAGDEAERVRQGELMHGPLQHMKGIELDPSGRGNQ